MVGKLHTSVDIDKIDSRVLYGLTINPSNQHDVKDASGYIVKDRPKAASKIMKIRLQGLKGSKYKLFFEVSPLGRLHWHGYIQIYDIKEWALNDIALLISLGAICIKPMTLDNRWPVYCKKQADLWGISISHINFPENMLVPYDKEPVPIVHLAYKEPPIAHYDDDFMEDDY